MRFRYIWALTIHDMPFKQNTFLPIDGKIIGTDHTRELAEMLVEEYDKLHSSGAQGITFSVKCFDNTSFSSQDVSLFQAKSPILKKRVRSIEMSIYPTAATFVKVGLLHGSDYDSVEKTYYNGSFFELGSDDSMWVNGFAARLQEWLDGVPDQKDPVEANKLWIYLISIVSATYLFGCVIDWFNINKHGYVPYWKEAFSTGGDWVASIVAALFVGGLVALVTAGNFINKSTDIWPMVELQIGPEHLLVEKQKRNYVNKIWTLLILPFLTSILSTVLFL